ncbi:hypothetical protein S7335_1087 [Synechococcus sp. PCC 7335]|uniref:hypothetical protein n=1 Tax=Synechococcus sp. (strain ATCC 29403 / PCC 7335) TaxID=91464 RepID=UPI00017EC0BB|nr:hypothetical protein [Synechococcus sp. PCC 7335]EDX82784.1 hypothetical protein S7335_1087 [Synechococcus sp. PCC 7335]
MSKDIDFLVELAELSTASEETLPTEKTDESMYRRCKVASKLLKPKLRQAAADGQYDSIAILKLYSSDFQSVKPFRRPRNSDVDSEAFQIFTWDLAEEGFRCFIDRPGLSSSLVAFQHCGISKSAQSDRWVLYVLLPQREPPRRYWARTLAFHAKKIVLHLLAFALVALISLLIFAA